jgi:aspartyl/asparaginyl-tRNA synthetase
LQNQHIGSSILCRGTIVRSLGKNQKIELKIDNDDHWVKVLGKCDATTYKLVKSKDKIKLEVIQLFTI